jgi:hypothetical protein
MCRGNHLPINRGQRRVHITFLQIVLFMVLWYFTCFFCNICDKKNSVISYLRQHDFIPSHLVPTFTVYADNNNNNHTIIIISYNNNNNYINEWNAVFPLRCFQQQCSGFCSCTMSCGRAHRALDGSPMEPLVLGCIPTATISCVLDGSPMEPVMLGCIPTATISCVLLKM